MALGDIRSNMIVIKDKYNCCGCTACSSICPYNAITMDTDSLGFLYPKVDTALCTNCGLCEKKCPFSEAYELYDNFRTPYVYSLRLKEHEELYKSQSGGAFYGIAKAILFSNGVIYGAAFTDDLRVVHQRVTDFNGLQRLRMSKYIQSDIRGVFHQVKRDLLEGLTVLFSGTPCQVSGLKSYLPKKLHARLYCIDLICHGVPSPHIWKDYIHYIEKKELSTVVGACFRDKSLGWHGATESFVLSDGRKLFRRTYNQMYFSGLTVRESCSCCHYTNIRRVGDISIGDQWGIYSNKAFFDNKGVSVVFINSSKGYELLSNVENEFDMETSSVEMSMQPQLSRPVSRNKKCAEFVRDYEKCGFEYVAKKYGDLGLNYKMIHYLRAIKGIMRKTFAR